MSPCDIDVLLHYHCCSNVHPHAKAPAVKDAIKWLVSIGMLNYDGADRYVTTDGGKMLVDALCSTPIPVQRWVMP